MGKTRDMRDYTNIYIDGAWVPSDGTGTIEVINAGTEQVMGSIPEGTPSDVDKAVAAARRAFESWAATPVEERQKYMIRLNEALQARSPEIAEVIAGEVGMPITWSTMIQAGLPAGNMQTYATLLDTFEFEETIGNSLVVKEPVGVVGAITPWNYPLHQIICKLGGALAAGCTFVLKPSEVAPLNAFILAEIIHEIGLPAGVFNLVTGTGPVVGVAIAEHPDVDMVSFTGSTRAGKQVAAAAAGTVKRVALELGGKSANIILDDADLEAVIPKGIFACYLNSGQTCTAHTRMLVPNSRYDEFAVAIAAAAAENMQVDDPSKEGMHLGPLISQAQWDRVQGYIQQGIDEGAVVAAGGLGKPEGKEKGYYVKPTVFAGVTRHDRSPRRRSSDPCCRSSPTRTRTTPCASPTTGVRPAGAVQSVGRSSVRSPSPGGCGPGRSTSTARRSTPQAPFGGYKQSGNTRERGRYGLEEFLETKSMQL
jgi:aldehyde dehydrogenase (NAD+)